MTIAFVIYSNAFLPALSGYKRFLSDYNIRMEVIKKEKLLTLQPAAEWHFMGIDRVQKREGIIKIHDYTSASVPPFHSLKNFIKRKLNVQPHYRLFQNDYVKQELGFKDHIPFGLRGVGFNSQLLSIADPDTANKEYDFIYTGDIAAHRNLHLLLPLFTHGNMKNKSILILSKNYEKEASALSAYKNIRFAGPIDSNEIGHYLRKAKFALNYIPDKEPFNQQTSTKFLEYAACRIPIITTEYPWIKQFQQQYGGRYFYLAPDLSNFNWENIRQFNYSFPDLTDWTWERQIRKSGVLEFLQSKFPELTF